MSTLLVLAPVRFSIGVALALHAPAARESDPCRQAHPGKALTVQLGGFAFTGAGRFDDGRGTVTVVWSGEQCSVWLRFRGDVRPTANERAVLLGAGGEFTVHQELPGELTEFSAGEGNEPITVNGAARVPSAHDSAWLAVMVGEFVRRTGWDAAGRASRIVAAHGLDALFVEVDSIPDNSVRADYLLAVAIKLPGSSDRAVFLRRSIALLDPGLGGIRFLQGVPVTWRTDAALLEVIYGAIASLDSFYPMDELLRRYPPPRPLPPALRPSLERLIDALPSTERRNELRRELLANTP